MSTFTSYRKLAKQLVRWHENRNYSVGERVRRLERFAELTDTEILARPLPLGVAQEIVAVEAGFASWGELKAFHDSEAVGASGPDDDRSTHQRPSQDHQRVGPAGVELRPAVPILFVRDVTAAAEWYTRLGFTIAFLHGKPAFYGEVSRSGARLHLRHVGRPTFAELAASEGSLILATVETDDVKALYDEFRELDIDIAQALTRQSWGGLDFHVRDPDGNTISFVQYTPAAG